jgi:hypothetical protein
MVWRLSKRNAIPRLEQVSRLELTRNVELNPKSSTPHYRLARIYDRFGKKQEAGLERSRHAALVAEEEAIASKQAARMLQLQRVQ